MQSCCCSMDLEIATRQLLLMPMSSSCSERPTVTCLSAMVCIFVWELRWLVWKGELPLRFFANACLLYASFLVKHSGTFQPCFSEAMSSSSLSGHRSVRQTGKI